MQDIRSRIQSLRERLDAVRPSCMECVTKHLGSALVLMSEANRGYPEHALLAIGHLSEAEDESQYQYPELAEAIRDIRKEYQSEGETPDVYRIVDLMRSLGVWVDGEEIEEPEMMRYQYRPDSLKCTPGKTAPCGDACRQPKNCEQNKPQQSTPKPPGKLDLAVEGLALQVRRSFTGEADNAPVSYTKSRGEELNNSAVAAFNRYGKNGAKLHLLKQMESLGAIADPKSEDFADIEPESVLQRDLFISALNKLDPARLNATSMRQQDRERIAAARAKRGAKEINPLPKVESKQAIASYLESITKNFGDQDWEEMNLAIAEARKTGGKSYGKQFIKERLGLGKDRLSRMVELEIDSIPDDDINPLVKQQKRAFVGKPYTKQQRLVKKDSVAQRLDSLRERFTFDSEFTDMDTNGFIRFDRQVCTAGKSQPCGDVCIPLRRMGKPVKCNPQEKARLGYKAKSALEGLRSRLSSKDRKLAQQQQSVRYQKKQLQAKAAWEARKQGESTQQQRTQPTSQQQRPKSVSYQAPKRDPWESQDYSTRRGTNPNYNESADKELLGVKEVDARGLNKAYRAAARQHHPDLGGSKEKMQRVNQAYENLKKKYKLDSRLDSAIPVSAGSYWVRMDAVKTTQKKSLNCTPGKTTQCGNVCRQPKNCKKGGTQRSPVPPKKGKPKERIKPKPVDETGKPGSIGEVSPDAIDVDPKRFQYKMIGEHTKTGEVGSLSGVQKYDPNLAGIVQVWKDPADGKTYVVNGHNRLALANRLGADKVAVRYLDVPDASTARAVGAITNIAEGRGTALDAAKFFRETGLSREDLAIKGIPMREKIATDGLALSQLEDSLFRKTIDGNMPIERAAIIGGSGLNHEEQRSLSNLIDQEAKKGRKLTNETVSELVDTVKSSTSQTEQQFSLFGAEEVTRNLAIEKAQLQAAIKKRLSREKKLFGIVGKSSAAQELERAGNVIDVETSKDISKSASQTLAVFDQLKNMSGSISSLINSASERIASGESAKTVQNELYRTIVDEIPKIIS